MSKREYLYMVGIRAIITVISLVYVYTGYMSNLSFPLHVDIIFYPLIGYFLMKVLAEENCRYLNVKSLIGFLLIFLTLAVFQANAFLSPVEHM